MARDNQRSERSRVRYGYCVNPDCENSKKDKKGNRKTYQISMREEFVCPDCKKELHECPPPQPQKPWKLIISLLVGFLAIGCGVYGFLQYKSTDTPGTTDLGYAIWDGELKNSQPDGQGKLSYTQSCAIESPDAKTRAAEVGDYIQGEYAEGKIVQGSWFDVNGVHKGEIPGAFDLGYATWDGELKDGLPDGQGTLTYLQSKAIEGPDKKARTADAGDYIKGKYADGKLIKGTWYNCENTKKGIIPEHTIQDLPGGDTTLDLGYAQWKGPVKNKKPHGQGVMTFKQSHSIDGDRIAEPGDYISGEYYEGHLVMGNWYGHSGAKKEFINIGRD